MTPAKARAKAILDRLKGVDNPVVVELGVFIGALSVELLRGRPDLTLYMVDSWGESVTQDYIDTNDFHANATKEQQKEWENTCRQAVEPFGDRAKIIKKSTVDAADSFPDNFFDLVFIDADHSYSGCMEDIQAWKDKVKYGGVLSGHDYLNDFGPWEFGVTQAVDEWVGTTGKNLHTGENFTWFTAM